MATVAIRNESASVQDRTLRFILPTAVADSVGLYASLSNGSTAVRADYDTHGSMYVARAEWDPDVNNVTVTALGSNPGWFFNFHEAYGTSECGSAVTFDANRAVPTVTLVTPTGRVNVAPDLKTITPQILIDTPRMKRMVWEQHFNGHHTAYVMDIFHEDAVAEVGVYYTWSDENHTQWRLPATHLELAFGQEIQPYFQAMHGWVYSNSNKTITLPFTFTSSNVSGREWHDWGNNVEHGVRILMWARMFGRPVSGTISADEAVFDACDHLEGVASATDWTDRYMFGKLPVIPLHRDVVRPDYADTTYNHYVTANHGYGGSDSTGSQGLCPSLYNETTGLQGAIGLMSGAQAIYGDQPVYDFLTCCVRWCLSPVYITRDGRFTIYSDIRNFALSHERPWVSYTGVNWGNKNNTNWDPPYGGSGAPYLAYQHYTLTGPCAAYALSHDYLAYLVLRDAMKTRAMEQRRGIIGSAVSGDREAGRTIMAILNMRIVAPSLASECDDFITSQNLGYLTNWEANMYLNPSHPDGNAYMTFHSEGAPTFTGPDGLTWNRYRDPTFEAKSLCCLYHCYRIYGRQVDLNIFQRVGAGIMKQAHYVALASGTQTGFHPGRAMCYQMQIGPNQIAGADLPVAYRSEGSAWATPNATLGPVTIAGGYALMIWGVGGTNLYAHIGADAVAKAYAREITLNSLESGQPNGWMTSHQVAASGFDPIT